MPGGIDAHTHLDMPFGGTTRPTISKPARARRRSAAPPRIVDFAIQARGTRMRDALDTWWKKAEGKACIDYGLHMIVTDLGNAAWKTWTTWCDEGVASFKLFMAYPNVLMVDDATIFKALAQTAKNGALICMHAENGSVIDVLIARALAEGKTAPIYHALTRPPLLPKPKPCIAPSPWRKLPARRSTSCTSLPKMRSTRCARRATAACRRSRKPARNICCSPSRSWSGPNFEGAKYVFTPPLRAKEASAEAVGRAEARPSASGFHRPLPVLLRRSEGAGQRRFHQDPQRRPGHREPAAVDLSSRRQCRASCRSTASWRLLPPRRRASSACIRRRAKSPPGSDADIVIWDPAAPVTSSARRPITCASTTPCSKAFEVQGNARTVLSRGEVIVDSGNFLGKPGRGNYLKRAARGGAWK